MSGDPTPENQDVVLIDDATVQMALQMLTGCEACLEYPEDIFASVLDILTGCDPSITEYVLESPTHCSQCGAEIDETSLVEWELDKLLLTHSG